MSKKALDFYKWMIEQEVEVDTAKHEPPFNQKTSEIEAQSAIIDLLELYQLQGKLFFQRINNIGVYDSKNKVYRSPGKGLHKGFPDIYILINGKSLFLEVKSNRGRQSIWQEKVQEKIESNGGLYYVVRSVAFVEKLIKSLTK